MEMITSKFKWIRLAIILALGLLAFNPFAQTLKAKAATPVTGIVCTTGLNFSLTAQAGYIQMPDMNTMYMWSYGMSGVGFQHPGPVLCVNQGDTVTVTLINSLPYSLSSSIIFPGQEDVLANGVPTQPEFDGTGKLTSLTRSAPSGGSVTYSFVASRPGTFIYESGTDPKTQVPMGMFGALIVRPAGNTSWVYAPTGNPDTSSQFDPNEEFLALLSEVDPFQHAAWEVGLNQGRNFNLNNYRARYWLINGRGFPDSVADNNASWLPTQPYGALARIEPYDASTHPYYALERFINVGTEEYPFHPHGQNGLVVGRDGYPLVGTGGQDLSFEKFAVNIGPGQTWDVLFRWYDAEGYNSATNPVPVAAPDLVNMTIGMFYSGSPYLGETQTMPPGTSTLNQCGEYYIISHNHALFQLDAYGQTMSGPITYLRVDPPGGCP
jgi:FtsP/CotA-like multicopper oxidase with cupredoxin domain